MEWIPTGERGGYYAARGCRVAWLLAHGSGTREAKAAAWTDELGRCTEATLATASELCIFASELRGAILGGAILGGAVSSATAATE